MRETTNGLQTIETPAVSTQPYPTSAGPPAFPPREDTRGFFRHIGSGLPTVAVLAVLAALAWWGHEMGWQVPKFSALTGGGPHKQEPWCGEHGVPESICVECNPDLLPKGKQHGWCKVHGVPECPFEHPEVAQLAYAPTIGAADLARARRALDFAPRPENNSKCKLHLRRIQFASKETFEKAGIDVDPVGEEPMVEYVSGNGEITYDQTRIARLSSRASGTVWWVAKQVGDPVKRGEIVALIEAPALGQAKAEFMQAFVQVDLKAKTLESQRAAAGAIPDRILRETEASLNEAKIRLLTAQQALVNLGLPIRTEEVKDLSPEGLAQRLQFLGLPESFRSDLDPRSTTANLLPLVAPLDGVVTAREVVAGEVVDTAKVIFVVADVSQMWLTLNLRLEDTKKVQLGQPVRFHTDSSADEISGTVAWMSTAVDEKTRTVKIRANLGNPQCRLRANTFGTGRIILRDEKSVVVVPNDAVHWEGDCFVVFVRDKRFLEDGAPKVFHTRSVRVGAKDDKFTEIIAGVLPGEVVASRGSGTLRSELLKNNLGEG